MSCSQIFYSQHLMTNYLFNINSYQNIILCVNRQLHTAKISKVIPLENITCQTGNKCYQMSGNEVSGNLEKLHNGI